MVARTFQDPVLGVITIRMHHMATGVKMRLSPRGGIIVTAPPRTPLFVLKRAVASSRDELQDLVARAAPPLYQDQQAIGQAHRLAIVHNSQATDVSVRRSDGYIVATIPRTCDPADSDVQEAIRRTVVTTLRREAKAYLPKRLRVLADRFGYDYNATRFPHASTRWGSCSSSGTIGMNIALMKLPLELIDYVLIHELCHTQHMNHSPAFWAAVAQADPQFKQHRSQLRTYTPNV
ncbi:hypothetical protein CR983_04260 [Candidatus Saccharibacteria bacterium]|nr:MAG: hypothetical protein CR983_04260 [Candidatus Saccharibacteria bacterium]